MQRTDKNLPKRPHAAAADTSRLRKKYASPAHSGHNTMQAQLRAGGCMGAAVCECSWALAGILRARTAPVVLFCVDEGSMHAGRMMWPGYFFFVGVEERPPQNTCGPRYFFAAGPVYFVPL